MTTTYRTVPKCSICGGDMEYIESSSGDGEFAWWECPIDGIGGDAEEDDE